MQKFAIDPAPHYCPCGAICGPTDTRCQKCIARLRWLRRKAWRANRVHRQTKTERQQESGNRT